MSRAAASSEVTGASVPPAAGTLMRPCRAPVETRTVWSGPQLALHIAGTRQIVIGGPPFASIRSSRLSRTAYNVAAFSPSAEEIRDMVLGAFPAAEITWEPDIKRQGIVDSWPAEVDDTAARRDWGFAPEYDFERAFAEYLIPRIVERYQRRRNDVMRR